METEQDEDNWSDDDFQEYIWRLLPHISKSWKWLARALCLDEPEIETIEHDYDKDGIMEMAYQALQKWKEKRGKKANKEVLQKALLKARITIHEISPDSFNSLVPLPQVTVGSVKGTELICNQKTLGYTEIIQKIQKQQLLEYSQMELPSVIFTEKILPLDKFYIDLQMFVTNEKGFEIEQGDIQVEDMFNKIENNIPLRILIDGNPGYGKTTLIHKLLVDWGKKESYIFSRFMIILPISLREFTGDLEDFLCEKLLCGKRYWCLKKLTKEEKLKLLTENENKILLLMDGYDELSEESKSLLLPLLNQYWYSDMTVVVTSRPGQFQKLRHTSFTVRAYQQDNNRIFWHKKVRIKGIAERNRRDFLKLYFGVSFNEIFNKLHKGTLKYIRELLECPLYLLLIACSLESVNVDNIKRKTDLYKIAIDYLVRRNLIRDGVIQINQHLDIFGDGELGRKYRTLLLQFGKLSLIMLEKDQLFFKENEISEHFEDNSAFIQLGLIVKNHSISKDHQETVSYEIVHKTFMEFSAAFYVAMNENPSNNLKHLMNKNITPINNEMLYAFLCGLFPTNDFLMNLEPWKFIYPINYYPISHFLLELRKFDESSLLHLIPSCWAIEENSRIKKGFTHSEHHRKLLTKGRHENIIQILKWDAHCNFFLPLRIRFPVLVLNIKETSERMYKDVLENLYKLKNRIVFCDYLICRFYRFHPSILHSVSRILSLISAKEVSVTIGVKINLCSAFKHIQDEIFNNIWSEKKINYFGISEVDVCTVENDFLSHLTQLIESGRIVHGLGLTFVSSESRKEALKSTDIKSLIMTVMKSQIQEFALLNKTNLKISFDVQSSFSKDFKLLLLSGNLAFSQNSLLKVDNLHFPLNMDSSDDNHTLENYIKVISCCTNLNQFKCGLNVLMALASYTKYEWQGFKSVTKLHLLLSHCSFKASELHVLACFNNLSFLSIDVVDLRKPKFFEEMANILFHILSKKIKIDVFALRRIDERGVGFVANLLKDILSYFQKSSWLKEFRIWFTCETNTGVRECLSLIKDLLKKGIIGNFCLTDLRGIGSLEDLVCSLFDVTKFSITRTVAKIETEEIILFKKDVTYEEIVTETICIKSKLGCLST